MVSAVCKMLVKEELKEFGLHYISVELGEVEILETISPEVYFQLKTSLQRWGLELMDEKTLYDKKKILIEKIKSLIINIVHYSEEQPKIKFSDYLSKKFNYDYPYISHLFSEVAGTTIEHYFIAQKVERVKELLLYNELCLSEIAYKMNYSSVAHLSSQFKNVTGLTISNFRELEHKQLIELEHVGVI